MMDKYLSGIEKGIILFSMSSYKFQYHTSQNIDNSHSNCAFPDCNSSFDSRMTTKLFTKLELALRGCPIVFPDHPANLNITRDKNWPTVTQIVRFRTANPVWL